MAAGDRRSAGISTRIISIRNRLPISQPVSRRWKRNSSSYPKCRPPHRRVCVGRANRRFPPRSGANHHASSVIAIVTITIAITIRWEAVVRSLSFAAAPETATACADDAAPTARVSRCIAVSSQEYQWLASLSGPRLDRAPAVRGISGSRRPLSRGGATPEDIDASRGHLVHLVDRSE